jgi:hypothetical protein
MPMLKIFILCFLLSCKKIHEIKDKFIAMMPIDSLGQLNQISLPEQPSAFGNGATCFGNVMDGNGKGMYPLLNFEIKLAGGLHWKPSVTPSAGQLTIDSTNIIKFSSINTQRFRFKLKPQPAANCPGLQNSATSLPSYTQAKFRMKLHTFSGGQLHEFHSMEIPVLNVGSCSPIYSKKIHFQDPGSSPIFVSVESFETNQRCLKAQADGLQAGDAEYDQYCPLKNGLAESSSCWNLVLQVANDMTDDFQTAPL